MRISDWSSDVCSSDLPRRQRKSAFDRQMDIEKCGIAGSAVQGLVELRAAMTVSHDLHARRHTMRAQSPAVDVITIDHQNAHTPLSLHSTPPFLHPTEPPRPAP